MATSNVNFVSALGAGSGIDTKSLAESLVEAERAPRKNIIDAKIKKEEAHITGYGAVKSLLATLQGALGKLNDVSDFRSITPSNTQASAFGVNASSQALAGTYDIQVDQVAKATRWATNSFSSNSMSLGTAPFDVSFLKTSDLATEQQTITFQPLLAGETVTVGGLTLTATVDMSAQSVAQAFKANDPAQGGTTYALSGTFSSNWRMGSLNLDQLTLTSQVANTDVGPIEISSSASTLPTVSSLDGNDGSATAVRVTVNTATPLGLMNAINAQTATHGFSAQMVKTGSGFALVFTGATGLSHDFVVSGLPSPLSMRSPALQMAQDAEISVNGLPITSDSNQLSDVIEGVTLNLYTPTDGSARLDLNRQTSTLKESLSALVTAYNDFDAGLKELGDSKSKLEQFGGTLAGESTVNSVRNLIRNLFSRDGKVYPDGDKSKPPINPDVNAAWQVGIGFDRYGKMTFNESKFDQAASAHFDQTVAFFTGNQEAQSLFSPAPGGLAGDAVKSIDKLLRSTGMLNQLTISANSRITQYQEQLTQLEDRMTLLLASYNRQFGAMENLVGQSKNTQTNLKSSFEGLMAMYTKN